MCDRSNKWLVNAGPRLMVTGAWFIAIALIAIRKTAHGPKLLPRQGRRHRHRFGELRDEDLLKSDPVWFGCSPGHRLRLAEYRATDEVRGSDHARDAHARRD